MQGIVEISTGEPLGTVGIYTGIPRFGFSELGRGMQCFWRSRSLAAVVADNLVDLNDDVFGNLGVNRLAIDHLGESNTLVIILRD